MQRGPALADPEAPGRLLGLPARVRHRARGEGPGRPLLRRRARPQGATRTPPAKAQRAGNRRRNPRIPPLTSTQGSPAAPSCRAFSLAIGALAVVGGALLAGLLLAGLLGHGSTPVRCT